MKLDHQVETRTIDPRVFNDMTEEAVVTLLGIARDFRSGLIKDSELYMLSFHSGYNIATPFSLEHNCGTVHCICGWMEIRLKKDRSIFLKPINGGALPLNNLFAFGSDWNHPVNDPIKAADAIENYLYNYAEKPWGLK